jgi:arylformamidase
MTKSKIHDISIPISESLVVWPGDPPVTITQQSHLNKGDSSTVSRLNMGAHTGTHVDAPCHFIPAGVGVEALDLNILTGPALVVTITDVDAITADVLSELPLPQDVKRLLFHTRNSDYWNQDNKKFKKEFVGITEGGAKWLLSRDIKLVGIDYLSVAPYKQSGPTHTALLKAGIILVEGLNLSGIEPGEYKLICLPLKISGIDGAPARAILIEE